MEEAGTWSSAREREAMQIERLADRVARAFLLERELFEGGWDQQFDGEVTGLIGAGAFVRFGGGHEGMLPLRRLRGDWWELNEEGTILTGERTGETLRLGDPVRVRSSASRRRAAASTSRRSSRPAPSFGLVESCSNSEHDSPDQRCAAYAAARSALRVATTSRISSQSTSLKLCIGQNFGPHIEQNSADLK